MVIDTIEDAIVFKDFLIRFFYKLNPREQYVVSERFFGTPTSYAIIGRRLGVCGQRIEQIQKRALFKLRRYYVSYCLDSCTPESRDNIKYRDYYADGVAYPELGYWDFLNLFLPDAHVAIKSK